MLKRIEEILEYLKPRIDYAPEVGIVLGTGLGGLISEIDVDVSIPYQDIPGFPVSTVDGHQGKLIFGILGSKKIVAMQGRLHYYEGYSMQELTLPIRVMSFLGIRFLILSNASGGVNPDFEIGDLMIITDHINLMAGNSLIGINNQEFGPRFPDMSQVYDPEIILKATNIARRHNIKYHTGVFAAVTGPVYETPAEYRYIRIIGADAVGMSTIPEAIVARQMGIPCFALSVITDLGVSGKIVEVSHTDVIEIASHVEPKVTLIIRELLTEL
ncbi:MAG: purine-nucleoside phosphorylase [Bacteroidales bacterium]|nr:purine-nucleoside phosphorylase [Bacteroidales bacterium]MDZ4204510.1 purine-nucleoside phosphorylase [Bacteroidales bacterium]